MRETHLGVREGLAPYLDRADIAIETAWARASQGLVERLIEATPRSAGRILEEVAADFAAELAEPIARSIIGAAELGGVAPAAEMNAFANATPEWAEASRRTGLPRAFEAMGQADTQAIANARIAGGTTVRGLPLSRQLHATAQRTAREATAAIQSNLRARAGMNELVTRMTEIIRPGMRDNVPAQYVQRLLDEARRAVLSGDREAFRRIVEPFRTRILSLSGVDNATTLRHASRRLADELTRAVREGSLDILTRATDRYMEERLVYRARVISRHETVQAYSDTYRAGVETTMRRAENATGLSPFVGWKFELSSAHPRIDECDAIADSNSGDGLPPGVYRENEQPDHPVHVNCLCVLLAYTDRSYAARLIARDLGRPEPPRDWLGHSTPERNDWLRQQSAERQREIVGPTRARLLNEGTNVLDLRTGRPIPLSVLTGG